MLEGTRNILHPGHAADFAFIMPHYRALNWHQFQLVNCRSTEKLTTNGKLDQTIYPVIFYSQIAVTGLPTDWPILLVAVDV